MPQSSSFALETVKGNATQEVKELAAKLATFRVDDRRGFADSVGARLRVTEVDIRPKQTALRKEEAVVVCEVDVLEDMVNGGGNMHGGCSAYLIDVCTSLPLGVLLKSAPGVSQAINMIYHAPAPLGTPLRIISTSVFVGGRVMTARGEIWDTKNSRLVASGVHVKMLGSQPKL
ncbi:hypothetical protein K439DRAFT_703312 [Ramaria rubella]|nr:hypothetical protein K439DRAFT_703312 [Ramaria rubella]